MESVLFWCLYFRSFYSFVSDEYWHHITLFFFPFVVCIIAMQYLFTSKYQVRHSFQISNPSSSLVESFQYCVHFLLQEWISYFSGHFWWSSEVVREAFLKLYQPGSVLQLSVKPQKGYIFDWYFFSTTTCTYIFLFIFILQITYWYVCWFVYVMKNALCFRKTALIIDNWSLAISRNDIL